MKKFEYKIIENHSRTITERESLEFSINTLGSQGWELVSVDSTGMRTLMYFKRQIETIPSVEKVD